MLANIIIYIFSFFFIWVGSGLAIKSVERLARMLHISSFLVSFLILGIFTSVSELSVGINSIIQNDPEIYVGNLIGGAIVIFLFLVPLLAITGNSIRVPKEFQGFNLLASLVVISLPVLLSLDGRVGPIDSISAVIIFVLLVFSIQAKKKITDQIKVLNIKSGTKIGKEIVRVIFGLALIFVASRFVVEQTLFFSGMLGISPFVISLVLIALGTNIPELSIVIRSMFIRNKQVAFGNYVGSATYNTFLLGALTLAYGKPVILTNSYITSLLFLVIGLILFYHFSKTKNTISRTEGFILLIIYIAFIVTQFALNI